MAGRGRGRGSTSSLTQEQLQALGIARGENTGQTLAPPPLFPRLEAKPLPLNVDAATEYMLVVKDQFIEYLHDSPAYVKHRVKTDDVERYSDKYKLLALDAKQGKTLDCVWANFPAELRPQAGKLRLTARKRKIDDPIEIAKKLQNLEKKENLQENVDNVDGQGKDTASNKDNSEEEELEEEQDYEVDDGTDYANNYFDNGEEYDEEDDTLDDGPVY